MVQQQASSGNSIMHDVVVYLSSLPRIADRNRKVQVLEAFVEGARSQGLNVLAQTLPHVVPARLAVILGWVGAKIKGPHIQLRRDVIDHQAAQAHEVMSVDGSCFKFADPGSVFLRYSLGGVYYNTNNYANRSSDGAKWSEISSTLGIQCRPWRQQGNHVLICLQRDGGWSMKGQDLTAWAVDTVRRLKKHTDRPIMIRPHPKNPIDSAMFREFKGVSLSTNTSLAQDLQGAWASVFYNSSSSVASVLAGIPVFVTDTDCVAWSVANHDLALIETPLMPDTQQWLWDLSAAHWTDKDSRCGAIVKKFQQYF